MLDMISIFLNLLGLKCDPRCGLSWRMFHVHLRRRCILLHLDGMSWRYQWDPSHLMYHLRLVFPYEFSVLMICRLVWVGSLSLLLLLCYCQFLFLCLLVFVLEKVMAPHSSTLAWKIPWTEEPGGLQSMGSRRVGHDRATSLSLFTFMHWRRKWQPTPVFLPGESQGRGSLVGCHLWGHTELDTTEVT